MDPTQALSEALTALLDGDRETAVDSLEALTGWLSRGGFLPDVDSAIVGLPTVAD